MSTTISLTQNSRTKRVRKICKSPGDYTLYGTGIAFRPYQDAPLQAIIESIVHHRGDTIVIIFPRQSGKDEFLLNLQLYLLDLYSVVPAAMVVVNPTYKPQTETALLRFDAALNRHPWTRGKWRKKGAYMRLLGHARCAFLSGDGKAAVVGATASLAIFVNEAQDVIASKYYKEFEPMLASTNATRIFAGTVWTTQTLLEQEKKHALEAEEADGRKRVFVIDANDVKKSVPWYGKHVANVIKKLGRQNPLVKTQYFNELIDAQAGMFNARRMALIATQDKKHDTPQAGSIYAFLVDVAGQDEAVMNDPGAELSNAGRDSVTLSIVEIDLSTIEIQSVPSYTVVHRQAWTGQNHLAIFGKLKSLANNWNMLYMVMDATGVGEGLWAMLDKALPGKIIPVKFSSKSKSEIGWAFLSIIETGRFHDATDHAGARKQYIACVSEIKPGPAKLLSWSVPETARDENGLLIHDDYLLADALVAKLDELSWYIGSKTTVIKTEFTE